jgi:hypothetical protein
MKNHVPNSLSESDECLFCTITYPTEDYLFQRRCGLVVPRAKKRFRPADNYNDDLLATHPSIMDHYAADENYFTEEGLQQGHADLVQKLEEKKEAHIQQKTKRKRRAVAQAQQAARRTRRSILIAIGIAVAGVVGGWLLSTFVLM